MVKQQATPTPTRHPKKTTVPERVVRNYQQIVYHKKRMQKIITSYNKLVEINQQMFRKLQVLWKEREETRWQIEWEGLDLVSSPLMSEEELDREWDKTLK
jgi:hypothetical protein